MITPCHAERTIHVKVLQSTHCQKRVNPPVHSFIIGICLSTGDWRRISSAWFVGGKVVRWRSLSVRFVFVTAYCPFLTIWRWETPSFCTSFTDKRHVAMRSCRTSQGGLMFSFDLLTWMKPVCGPWWPWHSFALALAIVFLDHGDHSLFCPGWDKAEEKTEKAMITNEQKTPKKASADDSWLQLQKFTWIKSCWLASDLTPAFFWTCLRTFSTGPLAILTGEVYASPSRNSLLPIRNPSKFGWTLWIQAFHSPPKSNHTQPHHQGYAQDQRWLYFAYQLLGCQIWREGSTSNAARGWWFSFFFSMRSFNIAKTSRHPKAAYGKHR